MTFYQCRFSGQKKIIEALNLTDAENKFQEKFGFWPSPELVTIEISKVRPVNG